MFQQKLKKFKGKKSWLPSSWTICLPLAAIILLVSVSAASAQETEMTPQELKVTLDTIWVVFAGCLVFFMNAGFAMLETGFCRRQNAVNILAKNLIVFAISTVAYWTIGFALMFGDGSWFVGTQGFFLNPIADFSSLDWTNVPLKAKFFFQLAFAGTAATIVSGAVAERVKFLAFIIFSLLLVGICYPITGHWVWGGGWLQQWGFSDFAGSTAVHSVGGCAALVGTALLRPRIGKYRENGQPVGIPGHNLSISTLGCLILWLGWFGFNAGSTMTADPDAISHILLTTNMAAATGGIAATITCWLYFDSHKPDLSMIINGVLAGLVAITASCRFVNTFWAAFIGAIAGIIVVFFVDFLESKLKFDDPVGAISVHLICGFWGTIAVGLFSQPRLLSPGDRVPVASLLYGGDFKQLLIQILGFSCVAIFTIIFSVVSWSIIGRLFGLRVSEKHENQGLDLSEHGIEAYKGFGK